MKRANTFGLVLLLILELPATVFSVEVLSHVESTGRESVANLSGPQAIDHFIEMGWRKQKLQPSKPAPDLVWLRRAYLDFLGRIPSLKEMESEAADFDKAKICDKLIENPEGVDYWARRWVRFFSDTNENNQVSADYNAFKEAWEKNQGWDEVAKKVITRSTYNSREQSEAISQVFLGTRIQCAQCHDQPSLNGDSPMPANSVTKGRFKINEHAAYTGMMEGKQGKIVVQDRYGKVSTTNPGFMGMHVNASGQIVSTKTGEVVHTGNYTPVEAAAKIIQHSELFPRAFVNRMWGNFFGKGLTSSDLDDFTEHHSLNHPGLMDELALRFKESGYKPKELMKWICKSKVYGLDSVVNDSNRKDEEYFSHRLLIPMNQEQLARSLAQVLHGGPEVKIKAPDTSYTDSQGTNRTIQGNETTSLRQWRREVQDFAASTAQPGQFMQSVQDTLALMNGDSVRKYLPGAPVLEASGDPARKVATLYLATTGVLPSAKETAAMTGYIAGRPNDTKEVYEDILWSLINSNQFRFSY